MQILTKATQQAAPTADNDLTNKKYVDAKVATMATSKHTHAIGDVTNLQASLNVKANLASPALTGAPTAPTAATATKNTQIANTAFVHAVVATKPNITYGTADLTPGVSALATGAVHLVYE